MLKSKLTASVATALLLVALVSVGAVRCVSGDENPSDSPISQEATSEPATLVAMDKRPIVRVPLDANEYSLAWLRENVGNSQITIEATGANEDYAFRSPFTLRTAAAESPQNRILLVDLELNAGPDKLADTASSNQALIDSLRGQGYHFALEGLSPKKESTDSAMPAAARTTIQVPLDANSYPSELLARNLGTGKIQLTAEASEMSVAGFAERTIHGEFTLSGWKLQPPKNEIILADLKITSPDADPNDVQSQIDDLLAKKFRFVLKGLAPLGEKVDLTIRGAEPSTDPQAEGDSFWWREEPVEANVPQTKLVQRVEVRLDGKFASDELLEANVGNRAIQVVAIRRAADPGTAGPVDVHHRFATGCQLIEFKKVGLPHPTTPKAFVGHPVAVLMVSTQPMRPGELVLSQRIVDDELQGGAHFRLEGLFDPEHPQRVDPGMSLPAAPPIPFAVGTPKDFVTVRIPVQTFKGAGIDQGKEIIPFDIMICSDESAVLPFAVRCSRVPKEVMVADFHELWNVPQGVGYEINQKISQELVDNLAKRGFKFRGMMSPPGPAAVTTSPNFSAAANATGGAAQPSSAAPMTGNFGVFGTQPAADVVIRVPIDPATFTVAEVKDLFSDRPFTITLDKHSARQDFAHFCRLQSVREVKEDDKPMTEITALVSSAQSKFYPYPGPVNQARIDYELKHGGSFGIVIPQGEAFSPSVSATPQASVTNNAIPAVPLSKPFNNAAKVTLAIPIKTDQPITAEVLKSQPLQTFALSTYLENSPSSWQTLASGCLLRDVSDVEAAGKSVEQDGEKFRLVTIAVPQLPGNAWLDQKRIDQMFESRIRFVLSTQAINANGFFEPQPTGAPSLPQGFSTPSGNIASGNFSIPAVTAVPTQTLPPMPIVGTWTQPAYPPHLTPPTPGQSAITLTPVQRFPSVTAPGPPPVYQTTPPLSVQAFSAAFNPLTEQKKQQAIAKLEQARTEDEKAKAREELRKVLADIFTSDMQQRDKQAQDIESRVKKLRDQYEARERAKNEIIDLQLQLLEKQAAGLEFPSR